MLKNLAGMILAQWIMAVREALGLHPLPRRYRKFLKRHQALPQRGSKPTLMEVARQYQAGEYLAGQDGEEEDS